MHMWKNLFLNLFICYANALQNAQIMHGSPILLLWIYAECE